MSRHFKFPPKTVQNPHELPLGIRKGQCFNTRCCLNGHHLECNQHDMMKRLSTLEGHDFVALSGEKYNNGGSILAVGITSPKDNAQGGRFYTLEADDIREKGRLDHSLVRVDCFCRITNNRKHIQKVESTVLSNTGIMGIINTMKEFVEFS